jgi:hypothetical protein
MYTEIEVRDPPSPPVVDHYWESDERFNADFNSAMKLIKKTLNEWPENPQNPISRVVQLRDSLRSRLGEQEEPIKGAPRNDLRKMAEDLSDRVTRYANRWRARLPPIITAIENAVGQVREGELETWRTLHSMYVSQRPELDPGAREVRRYQAELDQLLLEIGFEETPPGSPAHTRRQC